jgi:monoamine oxidase
MDQQDIIIIGAGAAGLMAARELSSSFNVTVLEAKNVIGGRIHTIRPSIEAGAEFVHGRLPVTLGVLKEAALSYTPIAGKMYTADEGEIKQEEGFIEGWDELMEKMGALTRDMTLKEFLETYYADHAYAGLRNEITRYVQGYDLADPSKVSMFSLYNEWSAEDDVNFRVDKGYCEMINFLAKGCNIITGSTVQKIEWEQGHVKVFTADKTYTAHKLIITVSLGILQHGLIHFTPAIDEYMNAASHIGFGSVIKILLEFKEPFWQEDAGFIISKEKVPTWWAQLPNTTPVLTGWLGGPPAEAFKKVGKEEILRVALLSLSNIFQKELPPLVNSYVFNWAENPETLGAYSYDTPLSDAARKVLNVPLGDTVYFAGEALYEGKHPGTVEAALVSGKNVAQLVKG